MKPLPEELNEKMTRVTSTVEGFALIRLDTAGRAIYLAPQLNLFPVVTLINCEWDPKAECGTWHFNIKIGEQPPKYFAPPSDGAIQQLEKPGGIVRRNPPGE